jgi:hypothetical protein
MATQSKAGKSKDGSKQSLSVPAVIAGVVILLLFFGWLAYRNFGPAPLPAEKPSPNASRIAKIFADSGGDWDKVSPADQQWIHQFSGGKEAMAWASMKSGGAKGQH